MMNRPAPYAEKLQFEVKYDTDRVLIADEMMEQGIEKINDIIDGGTSNKRIH